jgi:hypothetical protein
MMLPSNGKSLLLPLLKTVYKNDEILTIINTHKKKDDLCDAFLMCVFYHIQNKK